MDSNKYQEEYEHREYEEYDDDVYEEGGDKELEYLREGTEEDLEYFDPNERHFGDDLHWDQAYQNVPVDVDSRSIKDQQKTRQHWEQRLSSGEEVLFPDQTIQAHKLQVKTSSQKAEETTGDDSIANLTFTKQQWEQKTEEHRKNQDQLSPRVRSPVVNNNTSKVYNYNKSDQYESAIDREIRLAQEREEELKREHEQAQKQAQQYKADRAKAESTMPIHKVPPPVSSGPQHHQPRQQTVTSTPQNDLRSSKDSTSSEGSPKTSAFNDMTEADRGMEMSKRESIIEKEIREQEERDHVLKEEGIIKMHSAPSNKEAEQSQYEREEKENLVNAQESIIDREIRLQRERESELSRQRQVVFHLNDPRAETPTESPPPLLPTSPTPTAAPPAKARSPSPQPPAQPKHSPPPAQTQKSQSQREPVTVHTTTVTKTSPVVASSTHSAPGEDQDMISYEDAIATYSHQGESLIARELREQKEKEEELRQHWTDMGFTVPEQSTKQETPFTLPEPKVHHKTVHTKKLEETHHTDTKSAKDSSNNVHDSASGRTRQMSGESDSSGKHASESQPSEPDHKGPRVLQMDDDDDGQATRPFFKFVPRNETPVEREIRLARERDNQLREEKGLPTDGADSPDYQPKEVVAEARSMPRKSTSEDPGITGKHQMKMLASSRLQLEMQREIKREQEMRQAGTIHSTSDQRIGDTFRYAKVVNEQTVTSARIPKTPKTPTEPKTPSTPEEFTPPKTEVKQEPSTPTQSTPVQNGSVPQREAVSTPPPAVSKTEPSVVKRYTKSATPEGGHTERYSLRSSTTFAESRIEQELREMKEREEDLRRQRELATGVKSPVSAYNGEEETSLARFSTSSEPHDDVHVVMRERNDDANAKSTRRKSHLAAEWEKKFGANV